MLCSRVECHRDFIYGLFSRNSENLDNNHPKTLQKRPFIGCSEMSGIIISDPHFDLYHFGTKPSLNTSHFTTTSPSLNTSHFTLLEYPTLHPTILPLHPITLPYHQTYHFTHFFFTLLFIIPLTRFFLSLFPYFYFYYSSIISGNFYYFCCF